MTPRNSTLVVDARSVRIPPHRRGDLKQALTALGHPVQDLAGYTDGEALTMRLTDAAPQAGSKPEQRADRNDSKRLAQHQRQERPAPATSGAMADAFAKLRK